MLHLLDQAVRHVAAQGDGRRARDLAAAVGLVRFTPSGLGLEHPAAAATTTPVSLRVSGLPDVVSLAVWTSSDRGKTWTAVPAAKDGTRWVVQVANPAGAGTISLKATAKSKTGLT